MLVANRLRSSLWTAISVDATTGGCQEAVRAASCNLRRFCRASEHNNKLEQLEQLTRKAQGKDADRLFQRIHDRHYVPVEEAAAQTESSGGTAGHILGWLANIGFYGSLLAASGFLGSTYVYKDEEVRDMSKAASQQAQDDEGLVSQGTAWFLQQFLSAREWYREKVEYFTEPPSDPLLPEQLPIQRHHGLRTLVLDLDDVLVHSHWNRQVGWKTLKRPSVDDFLEIMCQYYEIVVFTNRPHMYADPILDRLDPGLQRKEPPMIAFRLYKNVTQWKNNESVRDLTRLNRDLTKTLFIVSASKAHTVEPADNVLVLPDWDGKDFEDTVLLDILPLLTLVIDADVPDTRQLCRSYAGKNVVEEFRRRMRAQNKAPEKQPQPAKRSKFFG